MPVQVVCAGEGGRLLGGPRSNTQCVSSVVTIIMKVVLNDCHAADSYQELEGTVGEMCLRGATSPYPVLGPGESALAWA